MYSSVWGEPFANKHTRLSMERKVYERLIADSRAAFPYEYTAFVAGHRSHVTDCISSPLLQSEEAAFHWDAEAFFSALKEINTKGLQWLGVIHTHPLSAALPSPSDHAGWHYPSLSYWILSLAQPEPDLRAYQMLDGLFHPRPYQLTR